MSPITLLKLASIGLMSISSCLAAGPAPVNLGAAGNFAILAKSGISSVPPSTVLGNMGISPAAATFVTGFSLILSPSGTFATSTQVVGQVLAATFKSPTPSTLTTSVGAFITAFNDANGRSNPTATGLGAGSIGGLTFAPGLYKWGTGVNIATDITISGTSLDTWIFQIAGTLTTASAVNIILVGGALPQNIVWVVSDAVTIGSTSVVNGIFLGATSIALNTGATANGRLLSQTAVTLEQATVNAPTATTITSTATSFSTSTVTATVTSTDTTTLSVTTTVVVTLPPATTTVGTGPSNQCNTGSLQCCASTQSATSSSIAGLLALLGVVVSSITGLVGVTCSPITAIGLGGTSCSEQPVCCTNNTFNGIIALGCTPINLNL